MDAPSQMESQVRQLLKSWKERARTNQIIHYDEEERLKHLHYWLGIPAIVLSAMVSTMMLILLKLVGEDWVKIVFGILGFVAAFLTTLQTFLKFSERAAAHKGAAVRYGCIFREIERVLALPLPSPDNADSILSRIESQLNAAAEETPTVPRRLWKSIKTQVTPPKA